MCIRDRKTIDLHGSSLESANKIVSEQIKLCSYSKIKKLIVINHYDCGAAKIINGKKIFNYVNESKIHRKSIPKSLKKWGFGGLGRSRDGLREALEPIWAPRREKERKQQFVNRPLGPQVGPKICQKSSNIGLLRHFHWKPELRRLQGANLDVLGTIRERFWTIFRRFWDILEAILASYLHRPMLRGAHHPTASEKPNFEEHTLMIRATRSRSIDR